MSKLSLHVNIAEPCHEDWNKMSATECGAFCKACSKEVIDFTNKSEREIVEILSQKQGRVCGKMNNNMLNRELVKYEPEPGFFHWKKWMIAATVLIGTRNVKAVIDTHPKPADVTSAKIDTVSAIAPVTDNMALNEEQKRGAALKDVTESSPPVVLDSVIILPEVEIVADKSSVVMEDPAVICSLPTMGIVSYYPPIETPKSQDTIHVSGRVLDEHGEGIPYATIVLDETRLGAISSEEGFYQLAIPLGELKKLGHKWTLSCSFIGYERESQPLHIQPEEKINFALQPQAEVSMKGEMQITLGKVDISQCRVQGVTPGQKIKNAVSRLSNKGRKKDK